MMKPIKLIRKVKQQIYFAVLLSLTPFYFTFSQPSNCSTDFYYIESICFDPPGCLIYTFYPLYSGAAPSYYCWDFGDNTYSYCQATPPPELAFWGPDPIPDTLITVSMVAYFQDSTPCDTVSKNICLGVSDSSCACFPADGPLFSYIIDTVANSVTFTNATLNQSNYNFLWYFGDGDTSSLVNPVHYYNKNGTYNVCLFNFDSSGCSFSKCVNILYDSKDSTYIVLKNPTYSNNFIDCAPKSFYMGVTGEAWGYNNAIDTITINFSFGDGKDSSFNKTINTDNQFSFYTKNHKYDNAGIYFPFCIAMAPDGKSDTLFLSNKVNLSDTCGNFSGIVYIDGNNNCIYDSAEDVVPHAPVTLLQNNQPYLYETTDNSGHYWFQAPVGPVYKLRIPNSYLASNGFTTVCPASGEIFVISPSSNNNFGLICNTNTHDLHGFLLIEGSLFPGLPTRFYLDAVNSRCLSVESAIVLKYPSQLTFISADSTPTLQGGDSLVWDSVIVSQGSNGGWENSLIFYSDTSLLAGDTVCFIIYFLPTAGDENPADNYIKICFTVMAPWDPNGKSVLPTGTGIAGNISPLIPYITYDIHFQNTGTAPAMNISIIDTIDTYFDMNTFRVVFSSHPVEVFRSKDSILYFSFANIILPDSASQPLNSQGHITYEISPKSSLPDGTKIDNISYIYFDYNPPIITNKVQNTIDYSLSIKENSNDLNRLVFYPVPATDRLILMAGQVENPSIFLYDMFGRKTNALLSYENDHYLFNLKNIPCGVYTLNILSPKHNLKEKIIILR